MELRQVKYFLSLNETLNFTRAAEACNVTQPTLTLAIKKLEDEMGGALVHRERNNTHLTQLGQMVLPFLQQVYESSCAASQLAQEIAKGERVPMNFGVSDAVDKSLLLDPLRRTSATAEGLELHVEGGTDAALVQGLTEGQLHVALVDEAAVTGDRLRFHPIYEEPMVVLMPEDHLLAATRSALTLSSVIDSPWVSLHGSAPHQVLADLFRERDTEWAPRHHATRSVEAQILCQAGVGLCLIGGNEPVLPGLVTRTLIDAPLVRVVGLAEARGRRMSSTVQSFARLLRAQSFDRAASINASGSGRMRASA